MKRLLFAGLLFTSAGAGGVLSAQDLRQDSSVTQDSSAAQDLRQSAQDLSARGENGLAFYGDFAKSAGLKAAQDAKDPKPSTAQDLRAQGGDLSARKISRESLQGGKILGQDLGERAPSVRVQYLADAALPARALSSFATPRNKPSAVQDLRQGLALQDLSQDSNAKDPAQDLAKDPKPNAVRDLNQNPSTAQETNATRAQTKLESVLVREKSEEEKIARIPSTVFLFKAQDLAKRGTTELFDTFVSEPGVYVNGGSGRVQNFKIRGLTGNRITVIKDGVAVSDGFGADDVNDVLGMNTFNINDLKQVKIIKGASSTSHYGSSAIGAVVSFESKEPLDYLGGADSYAELGYKFHSINDKHRGEFALARKLYTSDANTSALDLSLSGGYSYGRHTKNYEQNVYERWIDTYNADLQAGAQLGDFYVLLAVGTYKEYARRKDGIVPTQYDGKWRKRSFWEQKFTTTHYARGALHYEPATPYVDYIKTLAYYRQTTNDQDKNILMERNKIGAHNVIEKKRQVETRRFADRSVGLKINGKSQFADAAPAAPDVLYGLDLKASRFERPVRINTKDDEKTKRVFKEPFRKAKTLTTGAYVDVNTHLGAFELSPSLRAEITRLEPQEHKENDNNGSLTSREISPMASLKYNQTDELNYYITYSYGFKGPSYDKVYGYIPHLFLGNPIADFVIEPNLGLKTEKSHNWELGTKYYAGDNSLSIALFYSKYQDFIAPRYIKQFTNYWVVQFVNITGQEIYGAELSARTKVNNFNLSLTLGVVDGKEDDGNYARTITPLEGNARAEYERGGFYGFLQGNFAGEMTRVPHNCSNFETKEDGLKCSGASGWFALDLGAGFRGKSFEVNLSAYNVLDKKYLRYQEIAGQLAENTAYDNMASRYFNLGARVWF